MKKIYYEKIGRRYVPVAEYDSDFYDSFRRGNHLVMCYPGGTSRRFDVDPDHAAMVAAGRVAEDAISHALVKASEMRPTRTPITEGQRKAWKKLAREFGDDLATLNVASARDIAEAGVQALQTQADVLLSNPAVRKAYDHFMLMCELTKENK
jgi:hypothetical protein